MWNLLLFALAVLHCLRYAGFSLVVVVFTMMYLMMYSSLSHPMVVGITTAFSSCVPAWWRKSQPKNTGTICMSLEGYSGLSETGHARLNVQLAAGRAVSIMSSAESAPNGSGPTALGCTRPTKRHCTEVLLCMQWIRLEAA